MKKFIAGVAFAAAAAMSASSASAATNLGNCGVAGVFDPAFTYIDCAGGYEKNVLNNSSSGVAAQIDALNLLGFDTTDFDYNNYLSIGKINSGDDPQLPEMSGITIFGIHFGGGSVLGNVTAFYKFDAGSGTSSIPFTTKGLSGFTLYQTGGDIVPEPATWALLIAGFGLVGTTIRRRRRTAQSVTA